MSSKQRDEAAAGREAELRRERETNEALRAERSELRRNVAELRRERNQLVRELDDERVRAARAARQIAQSRAWRFGHGAARLVRALSLRESGDQPGAPEALAERLERPLDLSGLDELGVPDTSREVKVTAEVLERIAARPPLTVVVPIHNAPLALEGCLAALARNTVGAEILLIDDASTDERVGSLLARYDRLPGVTTLRSASNRGFAATVNRGFEQAAGRDVVVLNSDAEVTPRWLDNLAFAAYSRPRIATATPFSNNAGAFSAPENRVSNALPEGVRGDELGRLVTQASERLFPDAPTGNGYCMYVRRAALEEVGSFDADSFPRGYGEETDFCLRASEAGWHHLVDDATFVIHASRSSFGDQKTALSKRGVRKIAERYPEYSARVREFLESREMERARRNVGVALAATQEKARPRVLFAHRVDSAGAPPMDLERLQELREGWDCLVLGAESRALTLSALENGGCTELSSWRLADPNRQELREIAASILVSYSVELLEVHTPFEHADELSTVAQTLGIPVA